MKILLYAPVLATVALISGYAWAVPALTVDEANFDFGTISSHQPVEHTFVVKNTGTSPLEILNVRSSCGCTVAAISQREIPPGESTSITSRFNPAGRRGHQRTAITLETNVPDSPRTTLMMSGTVQELVLVEPNGLFLGAMGMGDSFQQSVDIINRHEQPMLITSITTAPEILNARAEVLEEGKQHRIHVSATGPFPIGDFRGHVIVKTSLPQHPQVVIPVFAQVAGALVTAPQEIVIPAASPNPVTRYVMVRPGIVTSFVVEEVIAPHDQMETQILALPQGQGYRIRINNITPDNSQNVSLRIRTNTKEMAWIEIPFRVIH